MVKKANKKFKDLKSRLIEMAAPPVKKSKMIRNRAQCLNCLDIIESHFTHDFTTCKCFDQKNGIFVDGGNDYQRAGGNFTHLKYLPPRRVK